MSLFHIHRWSPWKTTEAFVGKYVFGGGHCVVVTQQRRCDKCGKIQIDRQTA